MSKMCEECQDNVQHSYGYIIEVSMLHEDTWHHSYLHYMHTLELVFKRLVFGTCHHTIHTKEKETFCTLLSLDIFAVTTFSKSVTCCVSYIQNCHDTFVVWKTFEPSNV